VRAVTALALLPGNLSVADKIGLLPVQKPSFSPDIGAGSTERTFRVCVSASEKFDRLLRVYSVEKLPLRSYSKNSGP